MAPQMLKSWFRLSSVTRVRRAADGKIRRVFHVFMCSQASDYLVLTSLDGICKPEVEIHQNRK